MSGQYISFIPNEFVYPFASNVLSVNSPGTAIQLEAILIIKTVNNNFLTINLILFRGIVEAYNLLFYDAIR